MVVVVVVVGSLSPQIMAVSVTLNSREHSTVTAAAQKKTFKAGY